MDDETALEEGSRNVLNERVRLLQGYVYRETSLVRTWR